MIHEEENTIINLTNKEMRPKLPFLILGRNGHATLFADVYPDMHLLLVKPVEKSYMRCGIAGDESLMFIDPPSGPMIGIGQTLDKIEFLNLNDSDKELKVVTTQDRGAIRVPEALVSCIEGGDVVTSIRACGSEHLKGYFLLAYGKLDLGEGLHVLPGETVMSAYARTKQKNQSDA